MNDDPNKGRAVVRGKPFISHDVNGHTIILCQETRFKVDKGERIGAVHTTKLIVNDNPSAAEIFKVRLTNPNE